MEIVNSSDLDAYVIKDPNEYDSSSSSSSERERERENSSVKQEIALEQLQRGCGMSVPVLRGMAT
jgi:hypothetical protein